MEEKKGFDLILILDTRVHEIKIFKYMLLVALNFKNENLKNILGNLPQASLSAILDIIPTSGACTKALVHARAIGLLNKFCSTKALYLKMFTYNYLSERDICMVSKRFGFYQQMINLQIVF